MDGGMGMGNGNMGMQNGHGRYQPPGAQRGICRDYFSESNPCTSCVTVYSFPQTTATVPAALFASSAMATTP